MPKSDTNNQTQVTPKRTVHLARELLAAKPRVRPVQNSLVCLVLVSQKYVAAWSNVSMYCASQRTRIPNHVTSNSMVVQSATTATLAL